MADLPGLLFNAKSEVFRLELLEQYKVDGEWQQFQRFVKGHKIEEDAQTREFCKLISESAKKGVKHVRVHVVPKKLTPYLRFEIETGYVPMMKAGASILLVEKSCYSNLLSKYFHNGSFNPKDFWMFDEKVLVELHYNNEGVFKELKLIDDEDTLHNYKMLKASLISEGVNLEDWAE